LLAFSNVAAFRSEHRAPAPPRCCRAPIPRRSFPPVARAARPIEPSPMLLTMVVAVMVLARRRL
jgi:hypothetical protein